MTEYHSTYNGNRPTSTPKIIIVYCRFFSVANFDEIGGVNVTMKMSTQSDFKFGKKFQARRDAIHHDHPLRNRRKKN